MRVWRGLTMQPELIAQISSAQLARNLRALRWTCREGLRICAALKANAYGHGVELVLPVLRRERVEMAAVSGLPEAVQLRDLGWTRPVLCLGQPFAVVDERQRAERLGAAVEHDVTPTLARFEDARDLSGLAVAAGRVLDVHVNVETGMGRLGVAPAEAVELCRVISGLPGLRLRGIYTHFSCAESPDLVHTSDQLACFARFLGRLETNGAGQRVQWIHVSNSSATLRGLGQAFDMVRVGLAMYGYRASPTVPMSPDIQPILRLVSHLIWVKELPAGHPVGYGASFVTERATRIGVVPIGYADGYLRALSNRAVMEVRGHLVPVIGNISMDLTVLDLTDLAAACEGDPVVIVDHRSDRPNSVQALAELLGTIPYEVTCLWGDRIHRVAVQEFQEHEPIETRSHDPSAMPVC